MNRPITEQMEESNLFDKKLLKYEEKLVEILLDLAHSKRTNPKMSAIACNLLIHGRLTQKELKELTGFSMGTISTYLSVMIGTGNFQKIRIPHTHTFVYSFSGELEALTTRAIEGALSSLSSIEIYLKNKKESLNNLIKKSKKGAKYLLERIEELIESFEKYKKLFPSDRKTTEEIQQNIPLRTLKRTKNEKLGPTEIIFDPEVYLIEDDIINQLISLPMFSMRDHMFIRILGYFMTRKYLTQNTLRSITGLSSGKISEEVNQLLENELIYIASTSEKGKITYGADSFILLRFTRNIINRMTKKTKDLENMKLLLEKNKADLESLKGFSQIYKTYNYTLSAISKYSKDFENLDKLIES